jgi:predicted phage baseplate assembly protein
VVFVTVQAADALSSLLARVATGGLSAQVTERDREIESLQPIPCFADRPLADDCLYIGIDQPVPWCVVTIRFGCSVALGGGVNPEDPPLAWEAYVESRGWVRCELERDETGGFNRPGDVVLHVPPGHAATVIGRHSAGWLRCRLLTPEPNQPTYSVSPIIETIEVFTTGVDCPAINAELVENEELGVSDGTPGQRFSAANAPLVPTNEPLLLQVAERPDQGEGGWVPWIEVDSFAGSEPDARHFTVDLASGEISFGPAVRLRSGELRQFGMVPSAGAHVRLRWYWHGGGSRGNVAAQSISVLKTAVKLVSEVTNRRGAAGGVDPESVESAIARGPIELRTIDRAVTAEDFELLVRRGTPEVARVRCLTASEHGEPGAVRVLLVPHVPDGDVDGSVPFRHFQVTDEIRQRVKEDLDRRRVVSTRVAVDEPVYRWVTVVAKVRARAGYRKDALENELMLQLHRYLHPVRGGPEGLGWPFGRPLHIGEIYATFQRVPGVEYVETVMLFPVNPTTQRPDNTDIPRLELAPNELVYSFRHDISVDEPE